MDKPTKEKSTPVDLGSLLELREFIATELDPIGSHNQLDRALKPLTDGLGLESPEKKTFVQGQSAQSPVTYEEPAPIKERPLAHVINRPEKQREEIAETSVEVNEALPESYDESLATQPPPPLPTKASFWRRALAGVVDQVFVAALFLVAFGVTLRLIHSGAAITIDSLRTMETPLLIRFAILEYAMIWFGYLTVAVGVLDMTFGMWVWGLKYHSSAERLGTLLFQKGRRVLFSFIFLAPIVTSLFLGFRSKGRNMLDLLSGMSVCRSV